MRLNVNDALSYLDLVKERFEGQGPTYITFLDVMRDFKAQTIDTNTVINRVRELFKDHPDLIGGFNSFIPEGYCMEGPNNQVKSASTLDDISIKAEEIENQKGRSPIKHTSENNQMQYNHALQFANKVKNRFITSPEVYRSFLRILHWYQNELRDNDATKRQNAEKTVSKEVASLFGGHNDLLREFNKFLPESSFVSNATNTNNLKRIASPAYNKNKPKNDEFQRRYNKPDSNQLKRSIQSETNSVTNQGHGTVKKSKFPDNNVRDISISDFTKIGNSTDLNVLQKIYDAFRNNSLSSQSYKCLLQNIQLFNNNMIKKDDLLDACKPLFSNQHVDLWRQLKDLLSNSKKNDVDKIAVQSMYEKRFDLDFSKLKTCGASYKILPYDYPQPLCTGRLNSPLSREVLNDYYISFASLASEDSQFVASKKSPFEESIYRVEDERYEVDMVVELNRGAMQSLLSVKHTMDKLSREELQNFKIDECLGGSSAVLMRKAIHRVYGEKANEVIIGLKRCPKTAVGLVINRMKQKEMEWKEAIKSYQRIWSDQDSRNYLKSLDHQGTVFKQKDSPLIKNKNFINQIESIAFGDRSLQSQMPSNLSDPISCLIFGSLHLIPIDHMAFANGDQLLFSESHKLNCLSNVGPLISPYYRINQSFTTTYGSHLINVYEGTGRMGSAHLALKFPDNDEHCSEVLEDAMSLIIHHVKRQTNSSKEDKKEMKFIIRSVVQDFFQNEHFPQSDDEEDEEEGDATPTNNEQNCDEEDQVKNENDGDEESSTHRYCNSKFLKKTSLVSQNNEESYSLFYGNNHWYCLIRLYHLLVSRLDLLKRRGDILVMEAAREAPTSIQAAEVLRLRKLYPLEPSKYYRRALSHVKDLLDGAEDIASYEDHLRDMFGIYAYPWFTMDKLIGNIVKQLHTVACNDPLSEKLTSLYLTWNGNYHYKNIRPNVKIRVPIFGVSGNIRNRIERLSDEVEYSCEVMQAFASDSNLNLDKNSDHQNNPPFPLATSNTNSNNNNNNNNTYTTTTNNNNNNNSNNPVSSNPSQPSSTTNVVPNTTTTNNNNQNAKEPDVGNEQACKTTSNCYPMIIMKKTSVILIRLTEPFSKKRSVKHQKHGNKSIQFVQLLQEQSAIENKCYNSYKKFLDYPDSECKNWLDYIVRYFINLTMNSPETNPSSENNTQSYYQTPIIIALSSRIRPVLLFRNVRKCVKALTNNYVNRKKIETLLNPDKKDPVEDLLEKDSKNIPASVADHHKLIMSIFKAELTKEELFRNTFNTDYMESNRDNKLCNYSEKGNSPTWSSNQINGTPKSYKINWSVGSYGIFYRHKETRVKMDDTARKQRFHNFLESKLIRSSMETKKDPDDTIEVCNK